MKMENGKITFTSNFERQMQFQRKVENLSFKHQLPIDDQVKFQYHMTAMAEELGEVLKADKRWKTHRNTNFNPAEKLSEIADCYITLMNISMWSGFNVQQVLEAISFKIDENYDRIARESQ